MLVARALFVIALYHTLEITKRLIKFPFLPMTAEKSPTFNVMKKIVIPVNIYEVTQRRIRGAYQSSSNLRN